MTSNPDGNPPTQRRLFRATFGRLVGGGRSTSRTSAFGAQTAAPGPDLVTIATLAIDHVGPATVRAVASGVQVCVTVPDEATAAIFRAALADTARRRTTDWLVRIIVDRT